MQCPVCHEEMVRHLVTHHFYWPKRVWQNAHKGVTNPVMKVHRNCEQHYHNFFLTYCKGCCQSSGCRYVLICYRAGKPDMCQVAEPR